MMMSAFCVTSLGEPQGMPPSRSKSSGTPLRECKNRVCPPLIRFPAMGLPMTPSPMKPIIAIRELSGKNLMDAF